MIEVKIGNLLTRGIARHLHVNASSQVKVYFEMFEIPHEITHELTLTQQALKLLVYCKSKNITEHLPVKVCPLTR